MKIGTFLILFSIILFLVGCQETPQENVCTFIEKTCICPECEEIPEQKEINCVELIKQQNLEINLLKTELTD